MRNCMVVMLAVLAAGCGSREEASVASGAPQPPAEPPAPTRFELPTANTNLFREDGGAAFYVETEGHDWTHGKFGCSRSGGWQLHEGMDIRPLERDEAGEAKDVVRAAMAGEVVYVNTDTWKSNYGKYVVVRHAVEEVKLFSLYAHLRNARKGLAAGNAVSAGEALGVLGRTANTRQKITKARAHLHFEINVTLNRNFAKWFRDVYRSDSNSHGEWHGWNLLGLDPEAIFLEQRKQGEAFSILKFIQSRAELCRVLVRQTDFPWIQEYAPLVDSPGQPDEEVAGYELVLNFNGVPTRAIPHSAMTVGEGPIYELLSVNNTERQTQRCGKLVIKKGARWEFTALGRRTLDILLFTP